MHLRVPAPVLISKFSDTTKALMDVMSKQASADSASALRWVSTLSSASDRNTAAVIIIISLHLQVLSCLATLLRKQDASVWTYPSTLQAYHGLLSFTVHSKPKVCSPEASECVTHWAQQQRIKTEFFCLQVRKAAQQGVCAILRGSDFLFRDNAPTHHPAAATTAKFCAKEIEQAGGAGNADATLTQSCLRLWWQFMPLPPGNKEDTTTLHVLGLLKELLGTFPLGAVKSCCETLLRVMTLSHVVRTQS